MTFFWSHNSNYFVRMKGLRVLKTCDFLSAGLSNTHHTQAFWLICQQSVEVVPPQKRQNLDCHEITDFSGRGGVSVIGVVGKKHDTFKTHEETQMNHVQISLCRTQPKFIQRDGGRGQKDIKIQPQQILGCSSWLKNPTGDDSGLFLTPIETPSKSVQSSFV